MRAGRAGVRAVHEVLTQEVHVTGSAGDIYALGGWANAKSVPNATTTDKGFGFAARYYRMNNTAWEVDHALKRGANEMHFYYDAQNRPAMVDFNGTYYMYLLNQQGDIVGLVDSSNNLVVEYKYDAWGRPTLKRSLTTAYDTLATLNPFRYRGYVYDEETGPHYALCRQSLLRS